MNAISILAALAAALALTACGEVKPAKPAPDTAKIVDTLRADEVHWNADWLSGDAGKITAHYAPTAVVMMAGSPVTAGAAAIKASVQDEINDPGFALTFASDKVDVAQSGDLAVARGHFTLKHTDPASKAVVAATGSFITVYKPGADGRWKAVWDITAPDAGAAAPSPGGPKS